MSYNVIEKYTCIMYCLSKNKALCNTNHVVKNYLKQSSCTSLLFVYPKFLQFTYTFTWNIIVKVIKLYLNFTLKIIKKKFFLYLTIGTTIVKYWIWLELIYSKIKILWIKYSTKLFKIFLEKSFVTTVIHSLGNKTNVMATY